MTDDRKNINDNIKEKRQCVGVNNIHICTTKYLHVQPRIVFHAHRANFKNKALKLLKNETFYSSIYEYNFDSNSIMAQMLLQI